MHFAQTLADFKRNVDFQLEEIFDRQINEVKSKDASLADALIYAKKLTLAGGKRIRPALVYWGCRSQGGGESDALWKACAAVELFHMFLLIHDDVMDNGTLRHGIASVNSHYEELGREFFEGSGDLRHFGNSMALVLGDIVCALANKTLLETGFDDKRAVAATVLMQRIIALTALGQWQDVMIEYRKTVTETDVLSMYEHKTAKYTFEGPLHLGLILAGCQDSTLHDAYSRFSVPLGIAFQIQDDILGVFGEEDKLGKSVGSDVAEGKRTLLVVKALQKSTGAERMELERILESGNPARHELETFRSIVSSSGALAYARKIANDYIGRSVAELDSLDMDSRAKEFLLAMTTYLKEREV